MEKQGIADHAKGNRGTDPVCGMSSEDSDAVGRAEHDGTPYSFCSESCREEFEANPEDDAD